MYKHILIATDGSELADKGMEHGLKLAKALGSEVTILTVSEPLSAEAAEAARRGGIKDPVVRYDQQIDEAMKARFAAIEKRAAAHGVGDVVGDDVESPVTGEARMASADVESEGE